MERAIADAAAALERGDVAAATEADARAALYGKILERLTTLGTLRAGTEPATVDSDMPPVPPLSMDGRIARSRAEGPGRRLIAVCWEAKLTLRALAEILRKEGIRTSRSGLSAAAIGKRPISLAVAKRVQELTRSKKHPKGYEPTRANWPDLRGD